MAWEAAVANHPGAFAAGLGVSVTVIAVALMALRPVDVDMSLALVPGAVQALIAPQHSRRHKRKTPVPGPSDTTWAFPHLHPAVQVVHAR